MKFPNFYRSTFLTLSLILVGTACAQDSQDKQALVESLQDGGKVIVMRHASSPRAVPDAESASEGNEELERELDEQGITDARGMGEALKRLEIEISMTGSSPTFRAMQTARMADLTNLLPLAELGSDNMQDTGEEKAAWLRRLTAKAPPSGNFLLITHTPNIRTAFPGLDGIEEGEALVFDPAVSSAEPVGQIKIAEWATF